MGKIFTRLRFLFKCLYLITFDTEVPNNLEEDSYARQYVLSGDKDLEILRLLRQDIRAIQVYQALIEGDGLFPVERLWPGYSCNVDDNGRMCYYIPMVFDSLEFLIFLPTVLALYAFWPRNYRWILLLIASYWFYMAWRWEYIFLIVLSTAVDYVSAIRIATAETEQGKKRWLTTSLAMNLGLLGLFKYYNFFNTALGSPFPVHHLLLPVGISFYTFQTMSYTIDVYRGKLQPERHLGRFALYVSFFPQLVAGPIERAVNLLPQLSIFDDINWKNFRMGFVRVVFGLFKKIVIADRVAALVNTVYASPELFNGPQLIIATVFFGVQIYCDFSAYSDIAIGTARMLNISIMENFNRPYISRSISEFWSRWHISLSTWFRDYVYIPLGGNRRTPLRVNVNLVVTFLLSGLWHGANWTFIIWGSYHGILLVMEKELEKRFGTWKRSWRSPLSWLQWLVTFGLVMAGWVFFRASSLADALTVFSRLFTGFGSFDPIQDFQGLGLNKTFFIWSVLLIAGLGVAHFLERRRSFVVWLDRHPTWEIILTQLAVLGILLMGALGSESQFIYFQF